MFTQEKVDRKLQEAYDHIKPYMKEQKSLSELCKQCEGWMGGYHDYEECRDKMCFKCWLAMVYLEWETSYE